MSSCAGATAYFVRLAEEERAWQAEQLRREELQERMEKLEKAIAVLQLQQNDEWPAHGNVPAEKETR